MGFAPIESAPTLVQQMEDGCHGGLHASIHQSHHQALHLSTHDLGGVEEAAMGIIPTAMMEQPWSSNHGAPPGIPFGQNAIRLLAAPCIDCAVFLPESEQPLNLPAEAGHDQLLREGEQAARDIGQQDGPICQRQEVFRRLAPIRFGIFCELFPPLVSPFFWVPAPRSGTEEHERCCPPELPSLSLLPPFEGEFPGVPADARFSSTGSGGAASA